MDLNYVDSTSKQKQFTASLVQMFRSPALR